MQYIIVAIQFILKVIKHLTFTEFISFENQLFGHILNTLSVHKPSITLFTQDFRYLGIILFVVLVNTLCHLFIFLIFRDHFVGLSRLTLYVICSYFLLHTKVSSFSIYHISGIYMKYFTYILCSCDLVGLNVFSPKTRTFYTKKSSCTYWHWLQVFYKINVLFDSDWVNAGVL